MQEAGIKDYEANAWIAAVAPAHTPAPIVTRLNRTFNDIMTSADTKAHFTRTWLGAGGQHAAGARRLHQERGRALGQGIARQPARPASSDSQGSDMSKQMTIGLVVPFAEDKVRRGIRCIPAWPSCARRRRALADAGRLRGSVRCHSGGGRSSRGEGRQRHHGDRHLAHILPWARGARPPVGRLACKHRASGLHHEPGDHRWLARSRRAAGCGRDGV